MLDIKFIRDNQKIVEEAIKNKKAKVNLDRVLELDEKKRDLQSRVEFLRQEKNKISKDKNSIEKAKQVKNMLRDLEPQLVEAAEALTEELAHIPNIPSVDTPVGKDETENKEIRKWGKIPDFAFKPKEHWELGEKLDILDTKVAGVVSGSRFNYLKGKLALLEFALAQFAYSILTDEKVLAEISQKAKLKVSAKPFIPVIPPVFIKTDVLWKMARLEPKEERYHLAKDDLYLVGSAEHTLGPIHMNEILREQDLPVRYAGFSTAFRREAGSYGKDTKGILRVHQFDKMELESFTTSETSTSEQDFIVAIQEHFMQLLEIPYRVMQICTGDMGGPDARQIDIECWMPGQNKYRETNTSDMMTDYQSRRLNTRVKKNDGTMEFAHMNDATAFAIGRTLIAIMENYQQADGSIKVPKVLQKYCNFNIIQK